MVTDPFKVVSGLLEQTVWFAPALAVGDAVKTMVISSVSGKQLPLPVEVSVNVTDPLETSEAAGV